MSLDNDLKSTIEKWYLSTPEDVHGVSYGFKIKGNSETNLASIVFKVDKKKPLSELKPEEIIPKTINVNGREYQTDVIEAERPKMLTCFPNASTNPTASYLSTDPNVTRLQGSVSPMLKPMRGGQEIIQFPTGWSAAGAGYSISLGTVGFFCQDDIDGKVIGVTNSHVAIYDRILLSERNIQQEKTAPYNIYDQKQWVVDGQTYPPSVISLDKGTNINFIGRIKRYVPVSDSLNYADAAIFEVDPSLIDNSSSKIWLPINEPEYNVPYPFASTLELDNLLGSNITIYSTGRTTGPKGYGNTDSCRLKIKDVGQTVTVTNGDGTSNDWSNCISFEYVDKSYWPSAGGDSGSAVIGNFGGVRKILGLLFAGSNTTSYLCRIDEVTQRLKIRRWDGSLNTTASTASLITLDLNDSRLSDPSIVIDGVTYYQAGFTYSNYTPIPSPTPSPIPAPAPTPTPTPSSTNSDCINWISAVTFTDSKYNRTTSGIYDKTKPSPLGVAPPIGVCGNPTISQKVSKSPTSLIVTTILTFDNCTPNSITVDVINITDQNALALGYVVTCAIRSVGPCTTGQSTLQPTSISELSDEAYIRSISCYNSSPTPPTPPTPPAPTPPPPTPTPVLNKPCVIWRRFTFGQPDGCNPGDSSVVGEGTPISYPSGSTFYKMVWTGRFSQYSSFLYSSNPNLENIYCAGIERVTYILYQVCCENGIINYCGKSIPSPTPAPTAISNTPSSSPSTTPVGTPTPTVRPPAPSPTPSPAPTATAGGNLAVSYEIKIRIVNAKSRWIVSSSTVAGTAYFFNGASDFAVYTKTAPIIGPDINQVNRQIGVKLDVIVAANKPTFYPKIVQTFTTSITNNTWPDLAFDPDQLGKITSVTNLSNSAIINFANNQPQAFNTNIKTNGGLFNANFDNENYGSSTVLSGDGKFLAIGAIDASAMLNGSLIESCGAVYIYKSSGTHWEFIQKLYSNAPFRDQHFGRSLAFSYDGSVLFIGAPGSNVQQGQCYYAHRASDDLFTVNGTLQLLLDMKNSDWGFSVCCSSDGNTVAFSSPNWSNVDTKANSTGAVSVYKRPNTSASWTRVAFLTLDEAIPNYRYGYSISMDNNGNYIAVGNYKAENISTSGSVSVYTKAGSNYILFNRFTDPAQPALFGRSVSMNGAGSLILVVNGDQSTSNSCSLFELTGTSYLKKQTIPTLKSGINYDYAVITKDSNKLLLGASGYKANQNVSKAGALVSCALKSGSFVIDEIITNDQPSIDDRLPSTIPAIDDAGTIVVAGMALVNKAVSFLLGTGYQKLRSDSKGFGASTSITKLGNYLAVASMDQPFYIDSGNNSYQVALYQRTGLRSFEYLGMVIDTAKPNTNLYNPLDLNLPSRMAHDNNMKTFAVSNFKNNNIIIADRDAALQNGSTYTLALNANIKGRGASIDVSSDGLTVITGCVYADGQAPSGITSPFTGAVEVFERPNLSSQWKQSGYFRPNDLFASPSQNKFPLFGYSCSITGTTGNRIIAAGAPETDNGVGSVYVTDFENRTSGSASIFKIKGDTYGGLSFGRSVKIFKDLNSLEYVLAVSDRNNFVYVFRGLTFNTLKYVGKSSVPQTIPPTEYGYALGISADDNHNLIITNPKSYGGDSLDQEGILYVMSADGLQQAINYKAIDGGKNAFTGYQIYTPRTTQGDASYNYTTVTAIGSPGNENNSGMVNIFFNT